VEKNRTTICSVLYEVFSKQECESLVRLGEEKGFELVSFQIDGREEFRPDVRNGERCIMDDDILAEKFWQKIKDHIPKYQGDTDEYEVVGLNERLRFLRYANGMNFKPHKDDPYIRPSGHPKHGERSFVTVLIYLNEGFEGGATTFFDEDKNAIPVVPEMGSVVVFQHDLWHEGSPLESGTKYAIRTDVMYRKKTA